jgi:hypothetical protein
MLTVALFGAASALLVLSWNRWFAPVPLRIALLFWLVCAAYQAGTLFTSRVDLPANLAFVAYPWQAAGASPVKANTGILFTEIAPWTRVARDILRGGEIPLWNRMSASGAPLLANQQTAIAHPFTLLGLFLPLGKAFTLTACLRLFFVAFFTFVLLRNWEVDSAAAVFGSIAYTFCTFHVVWLLFPLGLATMMLPLCLVGVQECNRTTRPAAWVVLLLGLSLSVLGGHPESALWVWIVTMVLAVVTCAGVSGPLAPRFRSLAIMASAFILALMITAFFWYPTLIALRVTSRFGGMQSQASNPANHGLSVDWLLPLVAPNVLGAPANGTYAPPRGHHAAVLNDYGEVASGYAGLATLGLALAAPFITRRRPLMIAFGLMFFSFLTFAEVPVWRDVVRAIPFAGIAIQQRLRIFWNLGVCIAAAMTVDAGMRAKRRGWVAAVLLLAIGGFCAIYAGRNPSFLHDPQGRIQFLVPILTTALVMLALRWERLLAPIAALLVFIDLGVATYRYNPSSKPEDAYPVTGAIAVLQHGTIPSRFVAAGWSFLPDTPSYYGIEDVKTTDPVQNAHYMRLVNGYLNVEPGSYDQVIGDTGQPFFDYLNIRYLYGPPGFTPSERKFVKRYEGPDGSVFENLAALPRYFLVQKFTVEPGFDRTVWLSRQIRDFRSEALVDHIPARVLRDAQALIAADRTLQGGFVRVRSYRNDRTVLDIDGRGWNLLVSSEVHWPGWRVYWNGRRQPSVVVNGAFLGCFVPPGKGVLELRYLPDEFTYGVRAGGLGLLLLLFVLGAAHARQRRVERMPGIPVAGIELNALPPAAASDGMGRD